LPRCIRFINQLFAIFYFDMATCCVFMCIFLYISISERGNSAPAPPRPGAAAAATMKIVEFLPRAAYNKVDLRRRAANQGPSPSPGGCGAGPGAPCALPSRIFPRLSPAMKKRAAKRARRAEGRAGQAKFGRAKIEQSQNQTKPKSNKTKIGWDAQGGFYGENGKGAEKRGAGDKF
jgi:hypothetical protein